MRFIPLLLLLTPILCSAFEPLNTDDTGTVAKSLNQIEQYFIKTASYGSSSAETRDISSPGGVLWQSRCSGLSLTYARRITDTIKGSIGATYYRNPSSHHSPLPNKVITLKWRFSEDDQWALALKPTITHPGSPQQVADLGLTLPSSSMNFIGSKYWDGIELNYTRSAKATQQIVIILLFSSPRRWYGPLSRG